MKAVAATLSTSGLLAPTTPVFLRVTPPEVAHVLVRDDVWPIHYLVERAAASGQRLLWHRFAEPWKSVFKSATWCMINEELKPGPGVPISIHTSPSPGTVQVTHHIWTNFCDWLSQRSTTRNSLSEVSALDFEDWADHARSRRASYEGRLGMLAALTRLWLYTRTFPEEHRLPRPPWADRGALIEYVGGRPASGDNRTHPIQDTTLKPLLQASWHVIETYERLVQSKGWTSTYADRTKIKGACLVVLSFLTGMRPLEVIMLRRGCMKRIVEADGRIAYEVRALAFKNVRDEDGRLVTAGRERDQPWVTIEPAYRAVRLLERSSRGDASEYLFSVEPTRRRRAGEVLTVTDGSRKVRRLIEIINSEVPTERRIPGDPFGAISLSRFRRTLAWFIARQPGGEILLGIQYGQLEVVTGAGYAGRRGTDLRTLVDMERLFATTEALANLADAVARGEHVSGPAAAEAIRRAQVVSEQVRFAGSRRDDAVVKQLAKSSAVRVYDDPHNMLLCVFQPARALCLTIPGYDIDAPNRPESSRCVASCPNIARTDEQIEQLRHAVHVQRGLLDLSPMPLRTRRMKQISVWEKIIENHEQTREGADRQ